MPNWCWKTRKSMPPKSSIWRETKQVSKYHIFLARFDFRGLFACFSPVRRKSTHYDRVFKVVMGTLPTDTAKIAFFVPAGVKAHLLGDFLCPRDIIEFSRDQKGRLISLSSRQWYEQRLSSLHDQYGLFWHPDLECK